MKKIILVMAILFLFTNAGCVWQKPERDLRREKELKELQDRFEWWPTDAKPGPVKDSERSGYWWWPAQPGEKKPWGNRGYIYLYKVIFDYKEEELPPPKEKELRPSLLIKKIIKNIKVYFDYNSAVLRDDVRKILSAAVGTLKRNPETSILITGNCDIRGTETYNEKLGRQRGDSVKEFMLENGIDGERIRIISRGKLDAAAPFTDLVGMQKDRSAQFVIAEAEEVMLPYPGEPENPEAKKIEEGKFLVEEKKDIESSVQVETKEYVIKKGDTLSKIAQEQLGKAYRWKYLYELNKDVIKNHNKLKAGKKIIIPVE